MEIEQLIRFDNILRKVGISGVYSKWGNSEYFSLGEGADNFVFPEYTFKTVKTAPVSIDSAKERDSDFLMTHLKNGEIKEVCIEFKEIAPYPNFFLKKSREINFFYYT